MNENKTNLTGIDLLIEKSKKINFTSESEVRNLGGKYPKNFKEKVTSYFCTVLTNQKLLDIVLMKYIFCYHCFPILL